MGVWGLQEYSYARWPWGAHWLAGTRLLPTLKGLDGTTGQQTVPPWGYACSKVSACPKAPQISVKHWTCIKLVLYALPGPKSNRMGSGRRKRDSPDHMMPDPSRMGRRTPTFVR